MKDDLRLAAKAMLVVIVVFAALALIKALAAHHIQVPAVGMSPAPGNTIIEEIR